jgi:hypothetical protein
MTETQAHKKIKQSSPNAFIQRIESASTSLGIPDSYFETDRIHGWAEVKACEYKDIPDKIRPDWRPGQMAWAMKYLSFKHRGKWILIIAINKGLYWTDEPKEIYRFKELNMFSSFRSVM